MFTSIVNMFIMFQMGSTETTDVLSIRNIFMTEI